MQQYHKPTNSPEFEPGGENEGGGRGIKQEYQTAGSEIGGRRENKRGSQTANPHVIFFQT